MNKFKVKAGDVIGFSGRNPMSDGINIATFGIPRWGISHVGIISGDRLNGDRLFESTSEKGVHSRPLRAAIGAYDGRVWAYTLIRPLYLHEYARMTNRLATFRGSDYDVRGALQSGGRVWSWVQAALRGEDLTSLFCSEFGAEVLSYIGLFPTSNASRWNPNHFVRKLRRLGIVNPPRRLK